MKLKRILFAIGVIVLTAGPVRARQMQDAQTLFDQFSDRLYQIKLIEKSSDEAYSTGSGFQITSQGHIATNYHVVAALIHKPEAYRLECIDENGVHRPLALLDIDIINDLAITRCRDIATNSFEFREIRPTKGAKIYAMGNPYDLSMAIVEGNYNGLLEDRLQERILFSGALNPGMSGGPAIDGLGRVVGINVSTRGNEIGFLVPVRFLKFLMTTVLGATEPVTDFDHRIEQQLMENQQRFMSDVLADDWQIEPYGDVLIPKIQKAYIKGWGEKDDSEKKMYRHMYSGYAISSGVYLSHGIVTGKLQVRYNWLETDQLNSVQFYNIIENIFNAYTSPNYSSSKDRSNYQKRTAFVRHAGMDWKISLAVRNYLKYAKLYDYTFNMVSLNKADRAIVVSAALSGVSKTNGDAFIRKFIGKIQWQK